MKLFHGGLIPVREPKILSADRIGDFGIGFYTTSSEEQARRFVQSKAARQNVAEGCLSIYDVPDDFLHNDFLRVRTFKAADEEWVDFVLKNRRQPDFAMIMILLRGRLRTIRCTPVLLCMKMT